MTKVLEARNIVKQFPGVLANDRVNFDLEQGEIHAMLGENGAGKTTLMNMLYGLLRPDQGNILVQGQPVQFNSPKDAIDAGIGMVHQHFMLVPVFTVTENIMLGAESVKAGFLDRTKVAGQVRQLSLQYGLDVDPDAIVGDLAVGVQQRVEIIKALYRQADILILDEPTAVLTPQEAEDLFSIMKKLNKQGVSIIFITHKLKEVMAVADRITVLRGGKVVGLNHTQETNEAELAALMVGREVLLQVEKGPAHPGEDILRVEDLQVLDDRKMEAVKGVSLYVRTGEILGVAGVQGNGQRELVEAITGLRSALGGRIWLGGQDKTSKSPRPLIEAGLAHIPEDRQRHGLVLSYPIADNLVLCTYYQKPFSNWTGWAQEEEISRNAEELVQQFDVRTPSVRTIASSLSGGNQQKVIVARELSRPVKLLVANQPTRGLDVGSIEYIHRKIIEMRDEGLGVLLVSAELDEIMALSDRIAVMYRGKIVAVVDADVANREQLGLLMAGASLEEAGVIV